MTLGKWSAIFVVAIVCLSALAWYLNTSRVSALDSKSATLTVVELGDIESLVTSQGTLEPSEYVDVGAQVSGMITKLHVTIGDSVKEGDLIAEIDPDVYEAALFAHQAQMKSLQAQRGEKETYLRQAQQKFDRNSRLFESAAVSEEALQDAQNSLDLTKANLMAAEAQIEEAQSTVDAAKTNLKFTKIYSPMDGTIVLRDVREGQTINASQTTPTIVRIARLDTMTVVAEVAEADVMKLDIGMEVYFSTLGSEGRTWEGAIRQVEPTPVEDNDVVLYNVLIDVDNGDRALMSGMTAQVFFVLANAHNVPVIPVSSLTNRVEARDTVQGRAYRIFVEEDAGVVSRLITVGATDRRNAAVLQGLAVGESVLTSPSVRDSTKNAINNSERRGSEGSRGRGRI